MAKMKTKFLRNNEKKFWLYLIGIFFIYCLIYYFPYFIDGLAIKSDDFSWKSDNITRIFSIYDLTGSWNPFSGLFGSSYYGKVITPTEIWLRIFPAVFSTNTLFMFMFSLLFWSTYLFFRSWDVQRIPAIISAIFITFSPSFHTFIRTGHIDKIILSPFVMFAFAFITMMFRKKKFALIYALLTTLSLSFAFDDGDPQVFLYFSPFFSLYALSLFFIKHQVSDANDNKNKFRNIEISNDKKSKLNTFIKEHYRNFLDNRKLIPIFVLIPFLTLGLSLQSIDNYTGKLNSSKDKHLELSDWIPLGVEQEVVKKLIPEEKTKKELENWYWATQWSIPKSETIDLFVPGFMGYLSRSPSEPYWGRVGQTEGWEQHRQGFQNYSLMTNYLGVFLIIFLIYGLIYCHPIIRIAGASLLVIFLILSYGKFSFAYRWFYELPYMSEFRNPNRFMQLFHFTASIIFGFGLSHYYEKIKVRLSSNSSPTPFNFFLIFFSIVMVIGVLGLIGFSIESAQLLAYFGARYPYKTATIIISNMNFYWIKATLIFSIACLMLHFFHKKVNLKNYKIWIGIILIFGLIDMYVVNKKFYWYEKPSTEETTFHKLLNGKIPGYEKYNGDDLQDNRRMFFLRTQDNGQYFQYLLYNAHLPLKLIDYTIVRKASDIPKKNRNFINILDNQDFRRLKIAGVRYVFSGQPINNSQFKLIYMDEIKHLNERVYLYDFITALPHFYIRGNPEFGNNLETTLGRMNENSFDIYRSVMLHDKVKNVLTDEQLSSLSPNPENKITIKEKVSRNEFILQADLKTPTVLIMNNNYNQNWSAESGNKVLPHFPANYFFNAFYLTPENKEIKVSFNFVNTQKTIFIIVNLLKYVLLAWVLFIVLKPFFKKS